jgi:iron(III) transport system ATP-binding protein
VKTPALELAGVAKAYGRAPVLHSVHLSVEPGSLTALLGPSGCGKTTLLRLIAGFDHPDSGTVTVDGTTVAGPGRRPLPPERRRIGYVPQEGALFPHLTVAGNILFGLPRADRRARRGLDRLLELTGLPVELAGRYPHQLSGGQQQRAALARALAPAPRLVLLDEPFSALDPALRTGTGQAVAEAIRAAGATGVLVTHDRSEALSLCDRVAVLHEGRLAQHGEPRTLYTAPGDPHVASMLGEAGILPGVAKADGNGIRCALGVLPVTGQVAPGPADVLIRPEQIVIGALDASDTSPAGHGPGVAATVTRVSYFGHDTLVELRLADGELLSARTGGEPQPDVGTVVSVTVRGPVRSFTAGPEGR